MKLYIQGEHGKLLTFTPEEIKEKLGIPFDIAALGIDVPALRPVHLVTKVLTSSSVT